MFTAHHKYRRRHTLLTRGKFYICTGRFAYDLKLFVHASSDGGARGEKKKWQQEEVMGIHDSGPNKMQDSSKSWQPSTHHRFFASRMKNRANESTGSLSTTCALP
jgi:hypothetical protein